MKGVSAPFFLGEKDVRKWRFDFCEGSFRYGAGHPGFYWDYSHVAIFLDGFVYHATNEVGVICQKLRDFLEPACLYDLYLYSKIDIQKVKKRANQHLGAPYNFAFYPDGSGFYCSQYIAEILPIFETIPMQFGDGEQEISDFWREYYRKLELPVPLNQPGTNPSQLAASPLLECKERNLHDSDF